MFGGIEQSLAGIGSAFSGINQAILGSQSQQMNQAVQAGGYGPWGAPEKQAQWLRDNPNSKLAQAMAQNGLVSPGYKRIYDLNTDTFRYALEDAPSTPTTQPITERKGIMDYFKGYLVKHRELLMGLGLALVLDHYIFGGAFKEKLQKIVHSILDKTEKKLIHEEA